MWILTAESCAHARRLQKVGWIFAQSTKEREFIMSAEEVCQMAAVQAELGERAVTAVVSMTVAEEGTPEIHFEAFQVSCLPPPVAKDRFMEFFWPIECPVICCTQSFLGRHLSIAVSHMPRLVHPVSS